MRPYPFSENDLRDLIEPRLSKPFVFLETASPDKENTRSMLFDDFSHTLIFNRKDDINTFFKKCERLIKQGYWLCGYFSYEFGYFLEGALANLEKGCDFPLAWIGACKKPLIINHAKYIPTPNNLNKLYDYTVKNITPNLTLPQYEQAIRKIKSYLEEGLTYQVNFTFKMKFDFIGSALDFYLNLRRSQPTSYAAFINTGGSTVISMSPELFFKKDKNNIISRPMKGTIKRGAYIKDDTQNQKALKKDAKTRAENVMIVDLLRNDLGRISKDVWVPKLFEVEKYRTLYQMTSTIQARPKDDLKIKELFSAIFPCGSVTGAPKIKTMQLIHALEKEPRNIYTGAIGYISPKNSAQFNVAIRTLLLDRARGEMGIGGGIVYDSNSKAEYEEAILKAKFFIDGFRPFSLIETMLFSPDKGYFLLDFHLKRLKYSCSYFSISLDFNKLKKDLINLVKSLSGANHKIRILVDLQGNMKIEKELLDEIVTPAKAKLSTKKINADDVFLYHKTTNRDFYNQELKTAREEGFFDIIFTNTMGELTEGAITNIFILKKDKLYTPPLHCGLLGGVLRQHLLMEKGVEEKILFPKDIQDADKIYIGNSVRGLMEVNVSLADFENKSKMKVYA